MRKVCRFAGLAPLALAVLIAPGHAHAADVGQDAASPKGKGIVGGALLGAELVLAVEAAADVQSPWAYLGGGLAGAAGGAVGGYFIEKDAPNARASMLLLAGGLTLAIPTTVAVLAATAYEPPADYLQDSPPADEPVANPPQPEGAPPPPAPAPATAPPAAAPPAAAPSEATPPSTTPPAPAPAAAPTGELRKEHRRYLARSRKPIPPLHFTPPALVDVTPTMLALSVPAVEVSGTYTRAELAMYGVDQATEVHIPVLNVVF